MGTTTKREMLRELQPGSRKASKAEKGGFLPPFCKLCNWNRKNAIQILNQDLTLPQRNQTSKRGRRKHMLILKKKGEKLYHEHHRVTLYFEATGERGKKPITPIEKPSF